MVKKAIYGISKGKTTSNKSVRLEIVLEIQIKRKSMTIYEKESFELFSLFIFVLIFLRILIHRLFGEKFHLV